MIFYSRFDILRNKREFHAVPQHGGLLDSDAMQAPNQLTLPYPRWRNCQLSKYYGATGHIWHWHNLDSISDNGACPCATAQCLSRMSHTAAQPFICDYSHYTFTNFPVIRIHWNLANALQDVLCHRFASILVSMGNLHLYLSGSNVCCLCFNRF